MAINEAMSSECACRLYGSVISRHQYLSLFSITSVQKKWPSRIHDLLWVNVSADDGLPGYVCSACRKHTEALEKAARDLVDF